MDERSATTSMSVTTQPPDGAETVVISAGLDCTYDGE
jgi:hypothetical protein